MFRFKKIPETITIQGHVVPVKEGIVTDDTGIKWEVHIDDQGDYIDIFAVPQLFQSYVQEYLNIGWFSHKCENDSCAHCDDEDRPESCLLCPSGCRYCKAAAIARVILRITSKKEVEETKKPWGKGTWRDFLNTPCANCGHPRGDHLNYCGKCLHASCNCKGFVPPKNII